MAIPNHQADHQLQSDIEVAAQLNYHREWRAFALRRYAALFFLYTWVPLCVGLFRWSRTTSHRPVESIFIMALWLTAAVAATWWAGEFRCPRCRRRYGALGHRKGDSNLTRGLFDKVCANCKLRKFESLR